MVGGDIEQYLKGIKIASVAGRDWGLEFIDNLGDNAPFYAVWKPLNCCSGCFKA